MANLNRSQLVVQSLLHYWRTNLAVLLGVIAGTAVIGGALVVGDSVKASLRQMTFDRLGKIDFALAGPRFVREQLAYEIIRNSESSKSLVGAIAPGIVMQAGLQSKSNNSTIWIEIPSAVPRDTLLGKKDNDSQEITLTVTAIALESSGLARLGLQPTQAMPLNVFVDLHVLQERLGLEEVKPNKRDPSGKVARVNALFNSQDFKAGSETTNTKSGKVHIPTMAETIAQGDVLKDAIQRNWTLADLNLRLVNHQSAGGIVLESEQMILEDKLAAAAVETATDMNLASAPVMVYLANKLWNPAVYQPGKRPGYSMYSTVAGLDLLDWEGTPFAGFEFLGEKPTSLGDDEVVLNEFLATDLQAKVGDKINFTYHTIGSRGELPELERSVTVRGIVAMTGTAIDRTLTPEVKGITDVASLADWDQPFPMDLDAVTPRDDEYWNSYKATPKLFMPLKTAVKLWPSRYGSLTSLRIAQKDIALNEREKSLASLNQQFSQKLLKNLNAADIGLQFQPVKAIGLMAASGTTPFAGLFFGFSIFLIIAAMILIGLLFRLGIEQRVRDLGLLGAIGFTANQVRRQMLTEGFFIAVTGGLIGSVLAVGYAKVMIYGLTHWWVDAVGTKNLVLEVWPPSLVIGFVIAIVAALFSIWWALRQLKQLCLREQLAGVTEKEVDVKTQLVRGQKVMRRAILCTVLAGILIATVVIGIVPAAGAFFGIGILLLIASLSFLSAWLQLEGGVAVRGSGLVAQGRLGLRNASRQKQRTIMTAGMIATATFLIVTVAAFRRDPTGDRPVKNSGNGGFVLVAESSSPVLYDINTPEGRQKLQLNPPEGSPAAKALNSMNVVPFRVKPGEDASCLNLYQTKVPKILGAPQSLIEQGRFAFASGSWRELIQQKKSSDTSASERDLSDSIPVLGDMNTLMYSLHKGVGATIAVPNDQHPQHILTVKGMFQDSVFQGVLIMSEEDFLRVYPEQKGFQYFLIEVPPEQAEVAASFLETELAEYGFDTEPVSERLARVLSVQNTYLSTFQTLGGLGLLLGTFGLATVMLRNVLERQAELALLRAVGFRERSVASLVLWENAFILLWGLIAGAGSALLATSPNLLSQGADLPWRSLAALLALVFGTGMLAAAFAVRAAARLPIVATLRGE